MSSTVPRAAAEWMAFHLRHFREDKDSTAERLENNGLGVLTIKELKHLGGILYSMVAVIEEMSICERRLPASAKKQRRIEFLRRGLFRDDPCTILNERLLRDMRAESHTSSTRSTRVSTTRSTLPAPMSSSATTRVSNSTPRHEISNGSRKRPNHEISQQPRPHQPQNRLSAEDATYFLHAYMSQHQPSSAIFPQYDPVQQNSSNPWDRMTMPSFPFEDYSASSGNYNNRERPNNGFQLQESNNSEALANPSSSDPSDTDSRPRDPIEANLLQQLMTMGFQKQETLDGIRQCRSGDNPFPSVDDIMLHLVSQREEAEEARREDEVRLQSEDQKQEESLRREHNQQESLSKATSGKDLKEIFPESWVLKVLSANETVDSNGKKRRSSVSIILGSDSRNDFVEFLKLEEKSRKWYGWVLPSGYFQKVATQLSRVAESEKIPSWATTCLRDERKKLRCGLYELKEQLKGQPKIFLDERPVKNDEIVVIDDDDNDD